MNKRDLYSEIVIAGLISAAMIVFRYSGKPTDAGFLDFLGIVAVCRLGIPENSPLMILLFIVWLLRFGLSSLAAIVVFWKAKKDRTINYGSVVAASFCINLLMGLGQMTSGE